MNFFKPKDFELVKIYPHEEALISIANLANAKLERKGKVVYASDLSVVEWYSETPEFKPTHKALLINIEPIEKCKHPAEKVKSKSEAIYGAFIGQLIKLDSWYECECGAKVKPKEFEESE